MNDDVLTLIGFTQTQDEYGVIREAPEKRTVFCQVYSISRAEFFGTGREGLNPEIEFKVFVGDYRGEKECEYHGKPYAIYRNYVYPGEDYIELYAERKGGTNGQTEGHS